MNDRAFYSSEVWRLYVDIIGARRRHPDVHNIITDFLDSFNSNVKKSIVHSVGHGGEWQERGEYPSWEELRRFKDDLEIIGVID